MLYGITGGIGSGKSTVSNHIRSLGYVVMDADQISRELMQYGSPLLEKLRRTFGEEIIDVHGELDRRLLAEMVFPDKNKTKKLNKLTHDAIMKRILDDYKRIIDKNPDAKVFADVPLLFEAGWENKFDKTILVTAPIDIRLERVKARDGMSEQEIKNRMARQMPEDKKAMKADFIMDNSKDIESLINKTNYILKLL